MRRLDAADPGIVWGVAGFEVIHVGMLAHSGRAGDQFGQDRADLRQSILVEHLGDDDHSVALDESLEE